MKVIHAGIVAASAALFTGCATLGDRPYPNFAEDGQYGYIKIEGDAAGLREYGTSLAGLVREGKAPDDAATTPYWEHRKEQERALTIQKISGSSAPGIGAMIKNFLTGKGAEQLPLK